MKEKILVVDDEKPIANILKYNLEKENFNVIVAYDGETAVEKAISEKPDLILLDIMLPKKNGFDVLREIRTEMIVPIIMLTAKEEEKDKISGLEMGADDYITKPFSIMEVIARINSNLRRSKYVDRKEEINSMIVNFGKLKIDFNTHDLWKNNVKIDITKREYELLKFFVLNPDKVFGREELLKEVWKYEFGDLRTIDVTIRRLREKIENNNDRYIITKRGVGYYFRRK